MVEITMMVCDRGCGTCKEKTAAVARTDTGVDGADVMTTAPGSRWPKLQINDIRDVLEATDES